MFVIELHVRQFLPSSDVAVECQTMTNKQQHARHTVYSTSVLHQPVTDKHTYMCAEMMTPFSVASLKHRMQGPRNADSIVPEQMNKTFTFVILTPRQ